MSLKPLRLKMTTFDYRRDYSNIVLLFSKAEITQDNNNNKVCYVKFDSEVPVYNWRSCHKANQYPTKRFN